MFFRCITSRTEEAKDSTPYNDFCFMTYLCKLSYREPNQILNEIARLGLAYVYIDIKDTDAQCYIFFNTRDVYVCFRGTSSIDDVKIDLSIGRDRYLNDKVKIHSGFLRQYISCRDMILLYLDAIIVGNRDIRKISFCGHSLGGALATIASADMAVLYGNHEIRYFSIGCPRVGNKAFKKLFNERVKVAYRVVNHEDPVQYVPISHRFYHVCPAICFYEDDSVKIKLNSVPVSLRLLNMLKNIDILNLSESHRLYYYEKNLAKRAI